MLIYLACPYSHPDPEVVESRFLTITTIAARLMDDGKFVFSPITHCHPMATNHKLPGGWDFWREYDELMISKCDRLHVIMMDGWKTSIGVIEEIMIAMKMGIPIDFINPQGE